MQMADKELNIGPKWSQAASEICPIFQKRADEASRSRKSESVPEG